MKKFTANAIATGLLILCRMKGKSSPPLGSRAKKKTSSSVPKQFLLHRIPTQKQKEAIKRSQEYGDKSFPVEALKSIRSSQEYGDKTGPYFELYRAHDFLIPEGDFVDFAAQMQARDLYLDFFDQMYFADMAYGPKPLTQKEQDDLEDQVEFMTHNFVESAGPEDQLFITTVVAQRTDQVESKIRELIKERLPLHVFEDFEFFIIKTYGKGLPKTVLVEVLLKKKKTPTTKQQQLGLFD